MFKDLFSEVNWRRILLVSVSVFVLDIILDLLLLFLATHIWSQPAQAHTANSVSSWTTYILILLATFVSAYWIASKVQKEPAVNGAIVGTVIGFLLFLASRGFGGAFLFDLVTLVFNMAVGYLGGAFGGRGRGAA